MNQLPNSIDHDGQKNSKRIEKICREQLHKLSVEHRENKIKADMWKARAFYSTLGLGIIGVIITTFVLIFVGATAIPIAAGFLSLFTALSVSLSKKCWQTGNAHSSDAMGILNEFNRILSIFMTMSTVNSNNGASSRPGDLHRDIPTAFDGSQ